MTSASSPDLTPGRPLVFRNATVLTMDDAHHVHQGADVLVTGERIADVGPALAVPKGTAEIDATGGIVMPGMIDTHRHMWQTAMRGYGADWTLTQYFECQQCDADRYRHEHPRPAHHDRGIHERDPDGAVTSEPDPGPAARE